MVEISNLQASLDEKRKELARLESELFVLQKERLGQLAQENGYASTDELILALCSVASASTAQKVLQGRNVVSETLPKKARRRAKVTPQLRSDIAAAINLGGTTARQLAMQFDVSESFVNTFKRRLGLTNRR